MEWFDPTSAVVGATAVLALILVVQCARFVWWDVRLHRSLREQERAAARRSR